MMTNCAKMAYFLYNIVVNFCDIIKIIGPSDAPIARLKDMWRKHLYIRSSDHKAYLEAMELIQEITEQAAVQKVSIFVTVC